MKFRRLAPPVIVSVLFVILFFILVSALGMAGALMLGVGHLSQDEMSAHYIFLHKLMLFYQAPLSLTLITLISVFVFCMAVWLVTTRVKGITAHVNRKGAAFLFIWFTFSIVFCVYAAAYLKPTGYDLLLRLDELVTREDYRSVLNLGPLKVVGGIIMIVPTILCVMLWTKIIKEFRSDVLLQEWFRTYQFKHRFLGRFGDESVGESPDLTLATDVETNTPVVLTGDSRQLGTGMIGPPGSGKTSMKIIVGVRQDLGHLQKAINAYPKLVAKYGAGTEQFKKVWAKHLTGIIVIEPAKDLCDDAYALAREHGLPEELITYLDPSDPNTPGYNAFVGPTEQVAEMISLVLDGISETTDEFFKQSCRVVLKQYIYLLKMLRKDDCDILDLDAMYQDPRLVADMVEELERMLPSPEVIKSFPHDKRIFWSLAERTVRWFWNDGLMVQKEKGGRNDGMIVRFGDGPYKGKPVVVDKQFEFTRQTRNLLSDLIMNPYLARVLTKKNAVDFDRLMSRGGILLCNTANGQLGQAMSDAFGKLVLISAQNAVFRRPGDEKSRSLVSAWVDEFYDYMNPSFLNLTSQGRKYKFAVFVACQTLAQFEVKYGLAFAKSMLGTIRNWVVYGGVGSADGELLSKEFGTKVVEELTVRDNITPETMQSPNRSYSESVVRKEMENVTADEIMFNEFSFSYIKMVVNKSTKRAFKAQGNFVDKGKAEKWKKAINPESLEIFMQDWKTFEDVSTRPFDQFIGGSDQLEEMIEQIQQDEIHLNKIRKEDSAVQAQLEIEFPDANNPGKNSKKAELEQKETPVESSSKEVKESVHPQQVDRDPLDDIIHASSLLFPNSNAKNEESEPVLEEPKREEVAEQVVESEVAVTSGVSVPHEKRPNSVVNVENGAPELDQVTTEEVKPATEVKKEDVTSPVVTPSDTKPSVQQRIDEVTHRRKSRKMDMLQPADTVDENNPFFKHFLGNNSKSSTTPKSNANKDKPKGGLGR